MGSVRTRSSVALQAVWRKVSPYPPLGDENRTDIATLLANVRSASRTEECEQILRFLRDHELTWDNLYKLFEKLEGALGSAIHERGWVSRTQLKRFTRTAQDNRVVGDSARHGHQPATRPIPSNPISLSEAKAMIMGLIRRYVDHALC